MNTRKRNRNTNAEAATPGFAIRITETTQLDGAMLIAEDEEGRYQPVAPVISISEAREIAASNMAGAMRRLERGDDPGFCVHVYKVWAYGVGGDFAVAAEIEP